MTIDSPATPAGPLDDVVGQPLAVSQLRNALAHPLHAYLFVGPRGSGKRQAAAAFAGELLAAADPEGAERHQRLASAESHPDLFILEPEGRALLVDEASVLITEASRAPVEGRRKVLMVDRFHTAETRVAPKLLKTIEEPPASSIFILLAEEVPPEQITISSRCVQIDFGPVSPTAIRDLLMSEGVDADRAETVSAAAAGSVERARLLVHDEQFVSRRDAWLSVPSRLDGTGTVVASLVDELSDLIDEAQTPLAAKHEAEQLELNAREEEFGTRGSGRKTLEARQKREIRAVRDDELKFGLATLAGLYRDQLATHLRPKALIEGLDRISKANEALGRNPNETLLLQALLVGLPELSGR